MKTILITGASGDIGAEIARTFAKKENNLILVYNSNKQSIETLEQELCSICNIEIFKCDLKNTKQIKKLVDEIIKKYKKIDFLINCAGISKFQQIQDTTEEDYYEIMDNNLKSTIMLTSTVSKHMISEKFGRIINIYSMWGVVGASMESLYSSSKGAINTITKALAKELGLSNITVNAICPGLIDTKMNKNLDNSAIKEIVESTPLNRIGTAKDVANLTEFLCSEKASFITGQIITVDGGFSL